jgi:hypothetical protein
MTVDDVQHRWRVRLLAAAMARQIDAIPPEASPVSRRIRIGKVRQRTASVPWDWSWGAWDWSWAAGEA